MCSSRMCVHGGASYAWLRAAQGVARRSRGSVVVASASMAWRDYEREETDQHHMMFK